MLKSSSSSSTSHQNKKKNNANLKLNPKPVAKMAFEQSNHSP
jgi:hypothetical protein